MDLSLLSAHEKKVLAVSVEVEAATPRQSREGRLLRVILHQERHPDVRQVVEGTRQRGPASDIWLEARW